MWINQNKFIKKNYDIFTLQFLGHNLSPVYRFSILLSTGIQDWVPDCVSVFRIEYRIVYRYSGLSTGLCIGTQDWYLSTHDWVLVLRIWIPIHRIEYWYSGLCTGTQDLNIGTHDWVRLSTGTRNWVPVHINFDTQCRKKSKNKKVKNYLLILAVHVRGVWYTPRSYTPNVGVALKIWSPNLK